MTTEPKCAVTDNESGKPCGGPAAGVARQATAPFYVCQADVPRAEAAGYVVTPLDLADDGGGRGDTSNPTPNPLSAQPGFDLNEALAERDRLAADLADAMREIAQWMRKSERVRAEVAAEIARDLDELAVRAVGPTTAAWTYAAQLAREHAATPAENVAAGSVVSTEGSGHPHPSAGPWTGPRPTLTPPDTEGEPNA